MIGIIVDGAGDYAAISARYKGRVKVVKSDGPRGHTVAEEAIAASAKKQLAILEAFGCTKIAIITDFEGRTCALKKFAEKINRKATELFSLEIIVVVADQMLENWLLADIAHISRQKKYLKKLRRQRVFESTHGKSELKKFFVAGYDYNEVKHSSELFPLVRSTEAIKFSPSFKYFIKQTGLD